MNPIARLFADLAAACGAPIDPDELAELRDRAVAADQSRAEIAARARTQLEQLGRQLAAAERERDHWRRRADQAEAEIGRHRKAAADAQQLVDRHPAGIAGRRPCTSPDHMAAIARLEAHDSAMAELTALFDAVHDHCRRHGIDATALVAARARGAAA